MRRGVIIALSVMGVLLVVLAVALAKVGTDLDLVRIERDDLQYYVEDLEQELDLLTSERGELQQHVDEQLKTIEQQKIELERARAD